MEMSKGKEIAVMMSTYNGSKYIHEQLESIINQKYVSIKLIIRDDGSADDTYDKLISFKENHPKHSITLIKGENVGYVNSFYLLTKFALENYPNIQYFSFSDHDDIWLSDKLITGIDHLTGDLCYPSLYCSNAMMTDVNLKEIGLFRNTIPNVNVYSCLIQNIVTGCTAVFNRAAALLYVNHQIRDIVVHDQYIYILCTLFGKTQYDNIPHILYRQHGSNQIGKPSVGKRLLLSIKKLFAKSHSLENRAQLIYSEFRNELSGEALVAVKKLALYRVSLRNRLSLFFDSNYKYDSMLCNIIFRIKILIGRV